MLAIKRKRQTSKKEFKTKTFKQLERHFKGVANHRRIEILFLIAKQGGISVDIISLRTRCNIKTVSGHLIRLENAGLIRKINVGRMVCHELSPYGKTICDFLETFSHS